MSSAFKFYSMGTVVEDKPQGVDIIMVSPLEVLNTQPVGDIKEYSKESKGEKQDLGSTSFKTNHSSKNYIRAKWSSIGGGNQTSAPDVKAGESVLLFQFGNVDEYYWEKIGREPSLRRLEDVLYSFSNLKDPDGKGFDENSSYWARVNTRDKYIKLHTSVNDGEACGYDVLIDLKAGVFSLTDTLGNSVVLASVEGNLTGTTNNDIVLNAGNNIVLNAGNDIVNGAGSNITQSAGSNISQSAGSNIGQTASSYGLSAGGTTMSAGTGGLNVGGNASFEGGSLTHNGANVGDGHIHDGVHGPTTPPIN